MTERTCTIVGCTKAHRARGLCATHYNRQQPNRHRKVSMACANCGETMIKDAGRDRRYANVYCSLICRDLHRLHLTGGDPARSARAARHPKIKTVELKPQAHSIYPRLCDECSTTYIGRTARARYCGITCRNRVRGRTKSKRHTIRRVEIFKRDQYTCWMCDRRCDPTAHVPQSDAPTVDHITPRSLGGSDDPDNLATACFTCNTRRGNRWVIPAPPLAA